MKFCPNCGGALMPQSRFCASCGARLEMVETPPAPPVQQTPVQQPYVPPVQQAPVQQLYAPPAQQTYAPPAAAPQGPGKKSGKTLLIIAAVAAVVVIGVILALVLGGKGDSVLGVYHCTDFVGMELEEGQCYIELKNDGEGVMNMLGDKVEVEWKLDGEELTLKADGEKMKATLKNEKITLEIEGEKLIFKKGGKVTGGKKEPDAPEAAAGEVGYWTLLRSENADSDLAMDEETVQLMKSIGLEYYMNLEEDGTGEGALPSGTHIEWDDGNMTFTELEIDGAYTIEDDQLILKMDYDTSEYIFVRGEGDAPAVQFGVTDITEPLPSDTTAAAVTADYSWWERDWYGWWIIADGTGEYEDMVEYYWDACASVTLTGANQGKLAIWYGADTSREIPFVNCDVEFSEGWGDLGSMYAVSGTVADGKIGYYDWSADPEFSSVSEFENMICLMGTYVDPNNGDNTFDYIFILRPWGMKWDDVEAADTSYSLYEDMMPGGYEDWYLPLLEAGLQKAPDSFPAGAELIK